MAGVIENLTDLGLLSALKEMIAAAGEMENLYRQDPIANAAIDATANNIAAVDLRGWDGPPDNLERERAKGLQATALLRLLQRPTPWHGGRDLISLSVIYYRLDGEVTYVLRDSAIAPVATEDQVPVYITVHPKSEVEPTRERGRPLVWLVKGRRIPNGAVIRVLKPDPDDPIRGLGCRTTLEVTGAVSWYCRNYLRAFYKNGADPGGTLETDAQLSQTQIDDLIDLWEARHAGAHKSNRVAVLTDGLKYNQGGQKHVDQQLLELLKFLRGETLMALQTPESELGLIKDATYSNGISANSGWWFQSLFPLMKEFEEGFNDPDVGLGRRFGGLYVGFDHQHVKSVLERTGDKIDQVAKAAGAGIPLNQAIDLVELPTPHVAGGDTPLVNAAMIPLSMAGQGLTMTSANAPQPSGSNALAAETRRAAFVRAAKNRHVNRANKLRDAVTPEFAAAMREVIVGIRQDQLAALDPLESKSIRDTGPADLPIFDVEKWKAEIVDAMHPLYVDAVQKAANTVEQETGKDLVVFEIQHPQVTAFVAKKDVQVQGVVDTVRDRIKDTMTKAIADNKDVAGIKKDLKAMFAEELDNIDAVALNEAGDAVNGGRFETMALEGITSHEWSAFIDGATRPSHAAANGEVVKIGDRFSNGLRYPNDPAAGAAEVVNCRCVALAAD